MSHIANAFTWSAQKILSITYYRIALNILLTHCFNFFFQRTCAGSHEAIYQWMERVLGVSFNFPVAASRGLKSRMDKPTPPPHIAPRSLPVVLRHEIQKVY